MKNDGAAPFGINIGIGEGALGDRRNEIDGNVQRRRRLIQMADHAFDLKIENQLLSTLNFFIMCTSC